MNNWIERNIIFPRINELVARQQSHTQVSKQLQDTDHHPHQSKKNSLNYFIEPQCKRKNFSTHVRNQHPKKHINREVRRSLQEAQASSRQQEVSSAVRKHITILELLDDRKNMFQSNQPKSVVRKAKSPREQPSTRSNKIDEIDIYNPILKLEKQIAKKKPHKYKWKTEPIDPALLSHRNQSAQPYKNDCLSIRKAKAFDYSTFAKEEQAQRESMRRKYSKVRHVQPLEKKGPKITALRGWHHQEEDGRRIMPDFSYVW